MTAEPLSKPPKPFAVWQIALVFGAAVAAEVLLGGGLVLACRAFAPSSGAAVSDFLFGPAGMALQIVLGSTLLGGIAFAASRLRGYSARDALALRAPSAKVLALAAIGVIPVGVLCDEATFLAARLAPGAFGTGVLDQFSQSFAAAPAPWFAALTAVVVIGPALGEELLFRGLILRGLAAKMSAVPAALATALLFGAIHFDALQGLGAALIGAYLAFAALASGSLWPAVAAHGVNNLLCALSARYDPQGEGAAFDAGHPWPVLAASAAALAVIAFAMVRLSRGGAPGSRPDLGTTP